MIIGLLMRAAVTSFRSLLVRRPGRGNFLTSARRREMIYVTAMRLCVGHKCTTCHMEIQLLKKKEKVGGVTKKRRL